MSCSDEDRELGDLHDWSNDVDSLVAAFESQGDCLLGLRSDVSDNSDKTRSLRKDGGFISWGAFFCMDQDGEPEELVVDYSDNPTLNKIHNAWLLAVGGES